MEISTIGLDLAKNVFQVHGVDLKGNVVVRRTLRRAQVLPFFAKLPPCLVGMEACGTAHHWARELIKLGHDVRQMPPAYVKPYVKRGKTAAADAEAICEAVTRPTMRDCQEFRVWAGIMGKKEPDYAPTQRACDTGRDPRPAAGGRRSQRRFRPGRPA